MDLQLHNSRIIDQFSNMGWHLKCLQYHGNGEPLLNNDLSRMVTYARKKNVADVIRIITNGIRLTRTMLSQLIDAGVDEIHISLDMVDRRRYKDVKGKDKIEKVLSHVNNAINMAERLKSFQLFIKFFDSQKGIIKKNAYGCKDSDAEAVLSQFKEVALSSTHVALKSQTLVKVFDRSKISNTACEIPFYLSYFRHNGLVSVCCSDITGNLIYGDLMKSHFIDIYNSNELMKIRCAHLNERLEDYPICQHCQNRTAVVLDQESRQQISIALLQQNKGN